MCWFFVCLGDSQMVFQSDYVENPHCSFSFDISFFCQPSRAVSLSVLFPFLMANDTEHCSYNLLDFM